MISLRLKLLSVILLFLSTVVFAVEFGLIMVGPNALQPVWTEEAVTLFHARLIYFALVALLVLFSIQHARGFFGRLRISYRQAYKSHYGLIDYITEQVSERCRRENEALPTNAFAPGMINKAVDCGRYRMKDGTLSPRMRIKLPWSLHMAVAGFALNRALIRKNTLIELLPLALAIIASISFVVHLL